MSDVMLSLGTEPDTFVFSVSGVGYDQLKRVSSYTWAKVNRVGRLPARQAVGPGDDTITLAGKIITERSGVGELSRLRSLMAKGEPVFLCDSFGAVHGKWCLESLSETQSHILGNGLPQKQTFSLKLSVYGEDNGGV